MLTPPVMFTYPKRGVFLTPIVGVVREYFEQEGYGHEILQHSKMRLCNKVFVNGFKRSTTTGNIPAGSRISSAMAWIGSGRDTLFHVDSFFQILPGLPNMHFMLGTQFPVEDLNRELQIPFVSIHNGVQRVRLAGDLNDPVAYAKDNDAFLFIMCPGDSIIMKVAPIMARDM